MDDQYCLTLHGSVPIKVSEADNLSSTQATLAAIGVALITQLLANAFGLVRKYVYHDSVSVHKRYGAFLLEDLCYILRATWM